MSSARVGIKTYSSAQNASSQSAHILRLHGGINGNEPKIIVIKEPKKDSFFLTPKMDPVERKRLRKKFQKCKDRAKAHRANDNILTAEKNEKEMELIRNILDSTEVELKNKVEFVELQFVITEFKPDEHASKFFGNQALKFIQEFFKDDVEIISAAAHLDQASTHSHFIIKPVGDTWTNILAKRGGYKETYFNITNEWNKRVAKTDTSNSLKLKSIQKGTSDDFVELPKFKKMMAEIDVKKSELDTREESVKKQEKELSLKKSEILLREEELEKRTEIILEGENLRKEGFTLSNMILELRGHLKELREYLFGMESDVNQIKEEIKAKEEEKEILLKSVQGQEYDDDDMSYMRNGKPQ